MYVK